MGGALLGHGQGEGAAHRQEAPEARAAADVREVLPGARRPVLRRGVPLPGRAAAGSDDRQAEAHQHPQNGSAHGTSVCPRASNGPSPGGGEGGGQGSCSQLGTTGRGGGMGGHPPPSHFPPSPPQPFKRLRQIVFRAFGQSKIFFGASTNSAPPEGVGGGLDPPLQRSPWGEGGGAVRQAGVGGGGEHRSERRLSGRKSVGQGAVEEREGMAGGQARAREEGCPALLTHPPPPPACLSMHRRGGTSSLHEVVGRPKQRNEGSYGGGGGRDALGGGGVPPPPPPSRAPSMCPATVPLTPSASLNGICNRQQPPPTALATSSNRLLNRLWGPFPSNASLGGGGGDFGGFGCAGLCRGGGAWPPQRPPDLVWGISRPI